MERRTIVIDPVTRIEGHAKITLHLNEKGRVEDARFHVTQFRGFEKFCEGRPFSEMPSLMARICGICPVSHLIASAKACDALMAVRIPPSADKLRRIFGLAQVVQSHALSLFHLVQLIRIGLEHPDIQFEIFYGVSDNATGWWDNSNARRFGYSPRGRSEDFRAEAMAGQAKLSADPIGDRFQGGPFCSDEYDADRNP